MDQDNEKIMTAIITLGVLIVSKGKKPTKKQITSVMDVFEKVYSHLSETKYFEN